MTKLRKAGLTRSRARLGSPKPTETSFELFQCTDKQKASAIQNRGAPNVCSANKKDNSDDKKNREEPYTYKTFYQSCSAVSERVQNPPSLPENEEETEKHWPQHQARKEK